MIYEEKYPNAKPKDRLYDDVLLVGTPGPCAVCGKETRFIDICWEAHICSDECEKELCDEFMQALNDYYEVSDEYIEELSRHEVPSCNF